MTAITDAYHKWLGIPPAEQPPTHYRLLGIAPFESDLDVIERAADQRMGYVRSLSVGKHAEIAQRILNELARAKLTLLRPSEKTSYDKSIANDTPTQRAPLTPVVLASPAEPWAFSINTPVRRPPALWQQPLVLGVAALALVGIATGIVLLSRGASTDVAAFEGQQESAKPLPADHSPLTPVAPPPARPPVPSAEGPETAPPRTPPVTEPSAVEPSPVATQLEPDEVTAPPPNDGTDQVPPTVPAAVPAEPGNEEAPVAAANEASAADALAAIPELAARQAAGKIVDEIYGGPFRSSKTDDEKAAVAAKMLSSARESKSDPAAMYVLLDRVRQVGALTGRVDLINDAISETALHFEVDRMKLLVASLETASSKTTDRERQSALVERTLELAIDIARTERFDLAPDLQTSLENHAQRARTVELRTQIRDGLRDIKLHQQQWQQAQLAREALVQDGDNSAAHLTVGKYLALTRGDWSEALPHLAKSGDAALAKAAAMDIAGTAGSTKEEQVQIGDAWHDYASTSKAHDRFFSRAAVWYHLAAPQVTGLIKAKVDSRLATIESRPTSAALGPEKLEEKNVWLPLAEKGYLTQCYTLGPFKPTEINDGLVFAYLRKHKPNEKLQERILQPVEATVRPLHGMTVPTFMGPDEIERFMYYVFEVKIDKDQSVIVTGDSFLRWGHNNIYVAVDALPIPNGTPVALRRGTHSIVVKQHFIKTDAGDRSFVRLQVEGENVLQKATLVPPPSSLYLDDSAESEAQIGIGTVGKHGLTQDGKPFTFQGKRPAHALFVHGKENASCHVTYRLQGKYSTFKASAGLSDPANDKKTSATPLTFVVLGDGKELWRSKPQQIMGRSQPCEVAIQGVNELTLRVDCPGKYDGAWSVWLDPLVTNEKPAK